MGISDRYIAKQIISATFFAVVVLCGVFLMGTIFKEARPLFVGQNPSPWLVFQFIWGILPLSLMFMIPCSFLAAILLTFGRMSSDNEITAMRMAGRSLYRISLPIFGIALLLCTFCYWLNTTAAPKSKATQKRILYEAVQTDPNKFLDPGVVKQQLKDQIVFVEDRKGDRLYGLHLFETDSKDGIRLPQGYSYAEEAELFVDNEQQQLRLKLINADIIPRIEPGEISHTLSIGEQEPLIFDFNEKKEKSYKPNRLQNHEIFEILSNPPADLPEKRRIALKNEIHSRYAFSLSCIAFAFVGIPLALNTRRKETSSGFVISIGVAVTYFFFFIFAKDKMDEPGPTAQILYWTPNILAVMVGTWLFRRAQSK